MLLFFLISGTVLISQANTLKCNECSNSGATCGSSELQCPADSTRCVTMRLLTYSGNSKDYDHMLGSCSKADHCNDASFNTGVERNFVMTKCCDTDKCNTEQPPLPDLKPNPNGRKCYSCDGKGDCTRTLNCDGDQTYCATGSDEGKIVKGCTTKSMCFNPSPLVTRIKVLMCCQGNYCNGSTSTNLLLQTSLFLFLFIYLWFLWTSQ